MYLLKINGHCQSKIDARELFGKITLNCWNQLMVHPLAYNKLSSDREILSQPENPVIEVKKSLLLEGDRFFTLEIIFDIINSEDPPQKLMFDLSLKGFNVELYHLSQDQLYFSSSSIKANTDFVYEEHANIDAVYEAGTELAVDQLHRPFTERDLRFSDSKNDALLRLLEVLNV